MPGGSSPRMTAWIADIPKLAHLDDAAIGVAEIFGGAVSDTALADLRGGVLAIHGRHVELHMGAAHERRRFG